MSGIPPDIVGSAAQAGYHQADVAKVRDAARAAQTHAADRHAKAIDEAGATIETDDDDTKVFADAEGAGGQGRATEEESNEGGAEDSVSDRDDGVCQTDNGEARLDIQA